MPPLLAQLRSQQIELTEATPSSGANPEVMTCQCGFHRYGSRALPKHMLERCVHIKQHKNHVLILVSDQHILFVCV